MFSCVCTGWVLWAVLGQRGGEGWRAGSQRLESLDAPTRARRVASAHCRLNTGFALFSVDVNLGIMSKLICGLKSCKQKESELNVLFVCPQRKKTRRKKTRRRWRIGASPDTQSGWMWSHLGKQFTGCPGGLTKPRANQKRTARTRTDRYSSSHLQYV